MHIAFITGTPNYTDMKEFIDEFRILSRLDKHKNIISLIGGVICNGVYVCVCVCVCVGVGVGVGVCLCVILTNLGSVIITFLQSCQMKHTLVGSLLECHVIVTCMFIMHMPGIHTYVLLHNFMSRNATSNWYGLNYVTSYLDGSLYVHSTTDHNFSVAHTVLVWLTLC